MLYNSKTMTEKSSQHKINEAYKAVKTGKKEIRVKVKDLDKLVSMLKNEVKKLDKL